MSNSSNGCRYARCVKIHDKIGRLRLATAAQGHDAEILELRFLSPAAAEGIGVLAGLSLSCRAIVAGMGCGYLKTQQRRSVLERGFPAGAKPRARSYSFERGIATLRAALEKIHIFPAPNYEALCCQATIPPL